MEKDEIFLLRRKGRSTGPGITKEVGIFYV
jgi:hypothetical protein